LIVLLYIATRSCGWIRAALVTGQIA
jgi:hypothetical protein